VQEGGEVSIFYDPMIAKLVTWGKTRDEAADLQIAALDAIELEGLGHNIDFLSALMQHPRFRSGDITTGFIAEEYPEGFEGAATSEERLRVIAAIAAGIEFTHQSRQRQISGQLDGRQGVTSEWAVRVDGVDHSVTLGDGHAMVNGHKAEGHCDWMPGDRTATATQADGPTLGLTVTRKRPSWQINTHGRSYTAHALPARLAPLKRRMIEKVPPDTSKMLLCPMPGLLVKLHVGEGEAVEAGQPLATVEAMKMENILRAEKSGTVASVNFGEGQTLVVDAVILELE
jgi:propionyl-CoA carboxylase alpha chain